MQKRTWEMLDLPTQCVKIGLHIGNFTCRKLESLGI
jgi:hypothetical protein